MRSRLVAVGGRLRYNGPRSARWASCLFIRRRWRYDLPQLPFLEGVRRLLNILVEGYATLNRRLWVLVIPIGLDLYL